MSKSKKRMRGKARVRNQQAKRAKKNYARKSEPKERRYLVGLNGGVITDGSYGLNAKGAVYVMATSEKEALENARAVMSHMHREGLALPDDGLDLDVTTTRMAGFKGPVIRLQDLAGYKPLKTEAPSVPGEPVASVAP